MSKVKGACKKALEVLGYRLIPEDFNYPKDLRDITNHPSKAKYYARASSFLLNVSPEKCIILWKYNCSKFVGNPFVDTIIDYCENRHIIYEGSKLEEYYNTFQPANVAELFNLKGNLNPDLVTLPPHARVLPWDNADMKKKLEYMKGSTRRENKARGIDLSLEHGKSDYGPVSKDKGKLEFNNLIKLTQSIKKHGYLRGGKHDQDISSVVLVHSDKYKYLIQGGMHRAAVLSALDYKDLPVRVEPSVIPSFVYRHEVKFWPKVKDGLYTMDQALHIFDLIFEGRGLKGSKVI